MLNYDFRNLNDKEFESLANDLISCREGKIVDRFKAGKDQGIDGRFYATPDSGTIIQSKHWLKSGIDALIKHLEKVELPKLQKLAPSRYILVSSLEMSAANKSKIRKALSPYIKSDLDILGKENLNDLLSKFKDVEKRHYKLWISSTNVLNTIFNYALTGRSEAKRDQIIEASQKYVITENHERALEKLHNSHTVIITGEAGIGKTTLADQLAHYYIAHGFELCVFEDDISEGEALFTSGEKKVFYFDDFLGRNYLTAIEGRKESRVLDFIDRVSKDKTKRFILTSRSTVLNQGKSWSDLFEIRKVEKNEYELTISSLSSLDKAKILYNHLWYGGLREEFIDELYLNKRYLSISKHRNYNPRLISFITDPERLVNVEAKDYWEYIENTLNNPRDLWSHVFDKQIDDLTRNAVCLVVFNGEKIKEDDLRRSFISMGLEERLFSNSSANSKYSLMIRSAIGSILNREIDPSNGSSTVDLFNPSVADFVLGRFSDDAHSLKTFFFSLNTIKSIENLEALKNNALNKGVYLQVLSALLQKLTTGLLPERIKYFLKIAYLVSQEKSLLSSDNIKILSAFADKINEFPVPEDLIKEARCLLSTYLSGGAEGASKVCIEFVSRACEAGITHDDLLELYSLEESLDFESDYERTEFVSRIKKSVRDYWEDQLSWVISEEDILGEYMSEEEAGKAHTALEDYLYDKLYLLDFAKEEILEIIDHVDINEKIYENIEAASRGDYDAEDNFRGSAGGSDTGDSAIEELFYREKA